jgi:hypothetical protein
LAPGLVEILLVPEVERYPYALRPEGVARIRGGALRHLIQNAKFGVPEKLSHAKRSQAYRFTCFLLRGDRGFFPNDEFALIIHHEGVYFQLEPRGDESILVPVDADASRLITESVKLILRERGRLPVEEMKWSPILPDGEGPDPFSGKTVLTEWPMENTTAP